MSPYRPFSHVPDDVTRLILFACRQHSMYRWSYTHDGRHALISVCSDWNSHILAMPEMWAALPITLATCPKFVQHAFDCAGGSETSVYLHLDSFDRLPHCYPGFSAAVRCKSIEAFCSDTLPIVIANFARIRRFTILCSFVSAWELVRPSLSRMVGSGLDSIAFCLPRGHTTHMPFTFPLGHNFSQLRLRELGQMWPSGTGFPRLTDVTLLRFRDILWKDFSSFIGSAPELARLALVRVQLKSQHAYPVLSIPSLVSLFVAYNAVADLDPLSALDMPKLAFLHASLCETSIVPFASAFASVLPRISRLQLSTPPPSEKELASVFDVLRDVQYLDFHLMGPSPFKYLIRRVETGSLCLPLLREVKVPYALDGARVPSWNTMEASPEPEALARFLAASARGLLAPVCCVIARSHRSSAYPLSRWYLNGSFLRHEEFTAHSIERPTADEWAGSNVAFY
ncbi:hypothetical protein C8R46DRAFT_1214103 [Mycena filopes]|nr:hypothetical protein C8R46DRAFT_1214103 [Mycena filopes]